MDVIEMETGTGELYCRIEDRVGVSTLYQPHKNALGDILTPALQQTVATLAADDRVGCVMITGAGDALRRAIRPARPCIGRHRNHPAVDERMSRTFLRHSAADISLGYFR